MDQVKEILRQAIKHRFWIAVGVAALLPVIAYFATSGSLKAETDAEAQKIKGAFEQVNGYASKPVRNERYKEAVAEKTEVISKDVDASWRILYAKQAPLLKWPEAVDAQFRQWGRKWPENTAPNLINGVIEDYLRVYPDAVAATYQVFQPWDPETGKGIVVAPPQEQLLRPAPFDPDKPPLPDLAKVWAAQEKLWLQGAVLDVIRRVNQQAKAEDWESAPIKRINDLVVASPAAQDQRSIAKGETLELAPDIADPSQPAEEETVATTEDATATEGAGYGGGEMPAGYASMMPGMGSAGMGGGGGAAAQADEVYVIKSTNPEQFTIFPFFLSVMVDQSKVPDLLVEFENSPMGLQVLEVEWQRPKERLQKPILGQQQQFADYSSGMMTGMSGMMRGYMEGMGAGGYGYGSARGGMESMMESMMGGMSDEGGGAYPGYGGGMGRFGGGTAKPLAKGKESGKLALLEKKAREKKAGKDEAKKEEAPAPGLSDPYYNYVELHVYGQARFFNAPPEEPTPESESATEPNPDDAAQAPEPTPKPDEPAPKDAAPKPDAAKTEDTPAPKAQDEAEPPQAR